jgi:hypothetical protein
VPLQEADQFARVFLKARRNLGTSRVREKNDQLRKIIFENTAEDQPHRPDLAFAAIFLSRSMLPGRKVPANASSIHFWWTLLSRPSSISGLR